MFLYYVDINLPWMRSDRNGTARHFTLTGIEPKTLIAFVLPERSFFVSSVRMFRIVCVQYSYRGEAGRLEAVLPHSAAGGRRLLASHS